MFHGTAIATDGRGGGLRGPVALAHVRCMRSSRVREIRMGICVSRPMRREAAVRPPGKGEAPPNPRASKLPSFVSGRAPSSSSAIAKPSASTAIHAVRASAGFGRRESFASNLHVLANANLDVLASADLRVLAGAGPAQSHQPQLQTRTQTQTQTQPLPSPPPAQRMAAIGRRQADDLGAKLTDAILSGIGQPAPSTANGMIQPGAPDAVRQAAPNNVAAAPRGEGAPMPPPEAMSVRPPDRRTPPGGPSVASPAASDRGASPGLLGIFRTGTRAAPSPPPCLLTRDTFITGLALTIDRSFVDGREPPRPAIDDGRTHKSTFMFQSRAVPCMTVTQYLRRLARYTDLSGEAMLLAMRYIAIVAHSHPNFPITILTIHRLLLARYLLPPYQPSCR